MTEGGRRVGIGVIMREERSGDQSELLRKERTR